MIANSQPYMAREDYLEAEKNSLIKHEYIQGEIYAMVGASDAHVTIAGNLFALLRNYLRGKGCRVYMADMKADIEVLDIYYYPDVIVTCDPRDREFQYFKRYPKLMIEVLSPGTEGFDRGKKFEDYRHLETLEEYVLINQNRVNIECFRKNSEGLWVLYPYSSGQEIYLDSLDFRCSITDLYEEVEFQVTT
ncbi:Uma2 family endonuclease [Planktothrix mougeotii]|uniref:Uma2 family endonuclease n=1 Tax=Planktothrix mougeotii LEGE 06226 TaxID=1828728 RepID=A0ABR9UIV1_9CYAN|nr:Uma2 family endonuclease [Planktothrix mougeotii]MBE9146081.1 Uma2 family endonuclease [Planktothrix mougeotii LEGE 06226]